MTRGDMEPEAILVIGPSWVGDMVMAQSLFRTLVDRWPGVAIDVWAPEWSGPVLERMPQVRAAITHGILHGEFRWRERRAQGRRLRGLYTHAIVLPRSFKSALIPFHAHVPVRTGYLGEMRLGLINDVRRCPRGQWGATARRFVALGLPSGQPWPVDVPPPMLEADRSNRRRLLRSLGLDTGGGVVALVPGAEYGAAKRWPADSYAELARGLEAMGRRVWVLGSERERELGEEICRGTSASVRNLCGETRLEDAIDLLALAETTVGNDSGLMHVAAATGSRVVALFGPTSPALTPPLTSRRVIHYLDLPCSPCFERECPLVHNRCMRDLGATRVLESVANNTD